MTDLPGDKSRESLVESASGCTGGSVAAEMAGV